MFPPNIIMRSDSFALSALNHLPPDILKMSTRELTMASVVSFVTSVARVLPQFKVLGTTKANTLVTINSDAGPVTKGLTISSLWKSTSTSTRGTNHICATNVTRVLLTEAPYGFIRSSTWRANLMLALTVVKVFPILPI